MEVEKLTTEQTSYIELFFNNLIDENETIEKPKVICEVFTEKNKSERWTRIFTENNISVIQGKAKTGKSFLLSIIVPSIISSTEINSFRSYATSTEKKAVIYFDTEQGDYDAYCNYKNIIKYCSEHQNFGYCKLRKYSPNERFNVIKATMEHYKEKLQFIVIDGIIDLMTSYNDEEQATEILSFLLHYTALYNCHICTVVHENKSKENKEATGWLGRYLYQKSETVISVENTSDSFVKKVTSVMQRGTRQFDSFKFMIDAYGTARILIDNEQVEEEVFF